MTEPFGPPAANCPLHAGPYTIKLKPPAGK